MAMTTINRSSGHSWQRIILYKVHSVMISLKMPHTHQCACFCRSIAACWNALGSFAEARLSTSSDAFSERCLTTAGKRCSAVPRAVVLLVIVLSVLLVLPVRSTQEWTSGRQTTGAPGGLSYASGSSERAVYDCRTSGAAGAAAIARSEEEPGRFSLRRRKEQQPGAKCRVQSRQAWGLD